MYVFQSVNLHFIQKSYQLQVLPLSFHETLLRQIGRFGLPPNQFGPRCSEHEVLWVLGDLGHFQTNNSMVRTSRTRPTYTFNVQVVQTDSHHLRQKVRDSFSQPVSTLCRWNPLFIFFILKMRVSNQQVTGQKVCNSHFTEALFPSNKQFYTPTSGWSYS